MILPARSIAPHSLSQRSWFTLYIDANDRSLERTVFVCYRFRYDSTALGVLGCLFSFLIYTQSVGLLGRGISPSQGGYLHTEQHKHRINAHKHPFLEWDPNRRPHCFRRKDSSYLKLRGHTFRPMYRKNVNNNL
jgi:hypothetical protein